VSERFLCSLVHKREQSSQVDLIVLAVLDDFIYYSPD